MRAEVTLFTSPQNLEVQRLALAGFCKQSLNFSFAQAFMGKKPTNAASACESLLVMQPA
jgi:hypothetical protein